MASKTQDQRLAFEAAVRANAVSYSIQLFIGRGQFERAEADTMAEAISIGTAMKEAHPTCYAQPIYYAIEPSGHSTTITPAQFQDSTNMIKTAVTTESVIAADRKAKNPERMRAARVVEPVAPVAEPLKSGLCPTRNEAIAQASLAYGDAAVGTDFAIQKTARGEWFWGPVEAAKKPARKAAKAARAAKATKAHAAAKSPSGKRADILAAAERGVIPSAPDFSAATHTRFRGKLAEVVALVEAGDIKGLKGYKINPVSSSPKAIDKYRNLAIVALKAKA